MRFNPPSTRRTLEWLRSLKLPSIDQTILEANFQQFEELEAHIGAFTSKIAQEAVGRPDMKLLVGFTGINHYSPMLVASEIPVLKRLISYVRLASGTRESTEKTIHGQR
jgi:hypothetical protein